MGCPETRLDGVAEEPGLIQDADPLRVAEALAHEGLQTVPGGLDIPVDPIEQPLPAVSGGISPASATCQPFLRSTGASRPRRDLATCSRDSRRVNRSAKRAWKAENASPQPSRSSSVVTTSVGGPPILPDGRPLASTVAVLAVVTLDQGRAGVPTGLPGREWVRRSRETDRDRSGEN